MKKLLYVPYEFVGPTAQNAKALTNDTGNWVYPGDCLSTSVHVFPANMGSFMRVHYARMRVAWTGQSRADGQVPIVRLVKADSGSPPIPENLSAWINPSALNSPVGSSADVTVQLQALLDAGVWKQLIIQPVGKMILNRAVLEVYWEIDVLTEDEVNALIDAKTTALEARIIALENQTLST